MIGCVKSGRSSRKCIDVFFAKHFMGVRKCISIFNPKYFCTSGCFLDDLEAIGIMFVGQAGKQKTV